MNSTSSISTNVNNIPMLNDTNFKKWKEHIIIMIGCMDLDYALRENRPPDLTSASTAEQRVVVEKWERIQSYESNDNETLNSQSYKGCNT